MAERTGEQRQTGGYLTVVDPQRVAVAGASGFVGHRLVPELVDAGHDVRALTRYPRDYSGPGRAVRADVGDADSLRDALAGCTAAYYLVHSLDHADFAERDAAGARNFGRAARHAGVRRIVYLSGLGDPDDDLSPHLRSRQQVEALLDADGVPTTSLRAGIVIGEGSASWEIIRTLAERVPALVVPRWALTRSQPIAVADVVRYLVGVLDVEDEISHVYDVGGTDILRYVDILSRVNALEGRAGLIVPVPIPARRLATLVAAQALPLITGVDARTIHTLLESMRNEVIVREDAIHDVVPFEPMGYDDAVLAAFAERREQHAAS